MSSLTRWLFDNGTKATPLSGVSDQLYLRTYAHVIAVDDARTAQRAGELFDVG